MLKRQYGKPRREITQITVEEIEKTGWATSLAMSRITRKGYELAMTQITVEEYEKPQTLPL